MSDEECFEDEIASVYSGSDGEVASVFSGSEAGSEAGDPFGDEADPFGGDDDPFGGDDADPFGGDEDPSGLNDDDEPGEEEDAETAINNAFVTGESEFDSENMEGAMENFELAVELESKIDDCDKMKMQDSDLPCTFKALVYMAKIHLQGGPSHTQGLRETWGKLLALFGKDWVSQGDRDDAMSSIVNNSSLSDIHGPDVAAELLASVIDQLPEGPTKFKALCDKANRDLRGGNYDAADAQLQGLYSYVKKSRENKDELLVMAMDAELRFELRRFTSLRKLHKQTSAERFKSVVMNNGSLEGRMHLSYGKMFMMSKKWTEAAAELDKALTLFMGESMDGMAKTCLRNIVLSNMVDNNPSDPFNRNSVSPLVNHKDVKAMVAVRAAFVNNEIRNFKNKLVSGTGIADDSFSSKFVDMVVTTLRTKMLTELTAPFECVALSYLEQELEVSRGELLEILSTLVLDDVLTGRIDQVNGFYKTSRKEELSGFYSGMSKWGRGLRLLQNGVVNKLESLEFKQKGGRSRMMMDHFFM